MEKELYALTISEALAGLKAGEFTREQLVNSVYDRIEELEDDIHAFITIIPREKALEQAIAFDNIAKEGKELPAFAGIPYSMKDTYVTKGIQTTAGSKTLDGFIPPYNATVYDKLAEAGAILVGKANCDPFGFGSSTENSAYGVTKNPVNTDYVPGGSSGGSAAAVAYGGGLFSIGEDTGGSIRCPASFCGLTGLKPTYGRVSRYGSIAYASSYDTVGPICKTSEDVAIIMSIIAGKDRHDATSNPVEVPDYVASLNDNKKYKIGLPKEYFGEGVAEEVNEVMQSAIEKLKAEGHEFIEISLPYTKYAISAYYLIGLSEASSNLARFDGTRFGLEDDATDWKDRVKNIRGKGFGPEEKRRVMIGSYALSTGYADQFYNKAQEVRNVLKEDMMRAFQEVDIILTPTMPILPPKVGENVDDPLQMWLIDAFTVSVNPIGVPGLSVTAGYAKNGLPVGMQLIAPHFEEERILNLGNMYENLD